MGLEVLINRKPPDVEEKEEIVQIGEAFDNHEKELTKLGLLYRKLGSDKEIVKMFQGSLIDIRIFEEEIGNIKEKIEITKKEIEKHKEDINRYGKPYLDEPLVI